MSFSEEIKRIRTKCFLSQYGFADELGLSVTTVNRWETGKHEPTTKIKRKIVELCKENNIKLEVED